MNALARILSRPVSAVLIDHRNMEPQIPFGSVAFMGEPGFVGEGLYTFGNAGWHPSDIRRVHGIGDRRFLSMDNWPGEPEEHATASIVAMAPQQKSLGLPYRSPRALRRSCGARSGGYDLHR